MANLPPHDLILAHVRSSRSKWGPPPPRGVTPVPPGPGQESVWDFPRPPRVDPVPERVVVTHAGVVLVDTDRARRIVETAGAPVVYVPPDAVKDAVLRENDNVTVCEWKGAAVHFDLVLPGAPVVRDAAFTYPDPLTDLGRGYETVAGWVGFYPQRVDSITMDGEVVRPQGGFYAGWVTDKIVGPIKGGPGTGHW
ncbi:MAG: DUF427 domain-containing protein [Myxococcota bacterium]